MEVPLQAVLIGTLSPLGPRNVTSGIDKFPAPRPIAVRRQGLVGDEQGDRKHHGGPEKALHHYAFDHYATWRQENPALSWRLATPGAFGENLSTEGITESDVCVGDIYQIGTTLVQVSQARQPCWRLNERFNNPTMAQQVQETGRTGWYYRILEEGLIGPGDTIALTDRPAPDWTLARVLNVFYRDTLNIEALTALSILSALSPSWRDLARRRLERGTIEDWSHRLGTRDQSH